MKLSEKGVVPVLLLVAALGLVAFLIFASTIQFKGGLFATLFPKRSSFAFDPISNPVTPTPTATPNPYTQASYATPTPVETTTPTPTLAPTPTPRPTPTPISGGGSVIKIYGAGTQANGVYPNMQLLINSINYQNYFGVIGVPGGFKEYVYTHPTKITNEHIQVRFANDLYISPDNDRNLIVDKINVDGVDYQTEAPTVFSTGSWDNINGCSPGRKQTEWLVCNGFFAYR